MPNIKFNMTCLTDWYQQPLGQTLGRIEDTELRQVLAKCFGRYLLQIGGRQLLSALQASPIPYHLGITQDSQPAPAFTYGTYDKLPIQSESVDVILLWHTLETVTHPETILAESWRTLTPDGHLIVLGFNPWSLWGLKHLFSQSCAPWNSHFHSAQKICHWANHINGELITAKSFFFRPPTESSQYLHRLQWLEAAGLWLWPHMGASYLLVIQKRTIPLTPIKLNWQLQPAAANKSWSPTAGNLRRE